MNLYPAQTSSMDPMNTEPAQTTCMDLMLQHQLEINLQQQVVTQELEQSLWIVTQELLQLKKSGSAADIPPLDL